MEGRWFDSPLPQIYHPRAMGQSSRATARLFFWILSGAALAGACHEKTAPAAPRIQVASLVPAATDLILGMGAAEHLVAVSNYDPAEVGGRKLPHVGDYQATDWETLASLRPQVMIIQIDPAHLPAGFAQNAAGLGIQLLNVRLDSLEDLLDESRRIGQAIGEARKGAAQAERLRDRLDAVRKKSAGRPPVKTLLTLDETAEALVGSPNVLDDLLRIAGGENVAAALHAPWPRPDHEAVRTLKPEVVIELKPNAGPGTLERAKAFWSGMPGAPAAASGRIYLLRQPYVLLPGAHVAEVAESMERCLHQNGTPPP
jgi:ABC-type hemin transport system substrate-binding protein